MGERGEALAKKFEQTNNEVIRAVEGFSDDQWRAQCQGEQWSVGVLAHHVAVSHQGIAGLVQAVASGQKMPGMTMAQIDEGNAEHAKQFASVSKQETLDMLRMGGEAAAQALRGYSDDQLDQKAVILQGMPKMTAEQAAENILIGHPAGHLQSMQAAVG